MTELFRRIYYLLNRRRLQRELQQELDFHREMLTVEARKDFGNPALLREQANELWGWGWLERLLQDVRFAGRLLRKSPGLTFTAITVLAVGIGINVTSFNILNVMFFRPLPVRDAHSLVRFTSKSPTSSMSSVAYPAAVFYRDHANVLSTVIAETHTQITLSEASPQSIQAGLTSGNYFSDLGVSAAYGRLFAPATDGASDAPAVVVLGYGFWRAHFGADPSVVGATIRLNQHPATIIGIMPFDFAGLDPEAAEKNAVWLLIEQEQYFVPESKILTSFDPVDRGVNMFGRLKPGISAKTAEQALLPLAEELVRQHPDVLPKGEHLVATPASYGGAISSNDVPKLGLIGALVLMILLAACGNLGSLLLGQALSRSREISIRLALGATRARILRQLMTESILLAFAGSLLALLLSWLSGKMVIRMFGGPGNLDMSPDWRTALFTFAIGMIASLAFGLPSARQAARQALHASRLRTVFMAVQVAASCVLLVISGLLVRALHNAFNADPGFDYRSVITIDPQLYSHSYSPAHAAQYMQELQTRLQDAGITSSALATIPPLGNRVSRMQVGEPDSFTLYFNGISPHLFQTMGIRLLRGRDFLKDDHDVAIVSETGAHRLWPGKDPLQQTFTLGHKKMPIVGVVGDARMIAPRDGIRGELYQPLTEENTSTAVLLLKTSQAPEDMLARVSQISRSVDPVLSPNVQLLKTAFNEKVGDSARMTVAVSAMGMLALVLAIIGLYGVVTYNVSQRNKEIGIRIALGATPRRIVQTMLSKFLLPLAVALCGGLGLAAALSVVLRSELYGISNFDPLSYFAAATLLAAVASLAAVVPARRALRVDPVTVLRYE